MSPADAIVLIVEAFAAGLGLGLFSVFVKGSR